MSHVNVTLETLEAEEWATDSRCHGWRVQDVIAHMAWFIHRIAEPELAVGTEAPASVEELNDVAVNERADWSTARVGEYYRQWSAAAIEVLSVADGPDRCHLVLEIDEDGTYRFGQLSDSVAFDHLVHLQCDMPGGHPLHPSDGMVVAVLVPATDWMIAELPQMNAGPLARVLRRPVGLVLTGTAAQMLVMTPSGAGIDVNVVHATCPDDIA